MASIAAMRDTKRAIVLALVLGAASGTVAGCGGDSGPDPSLSADQAATLDSKLQEIQDNVDVGSCLVAADRVDDLLADVNELPDSVNQQVKNALTRGATSLKGLLEDPDKCESRTTTTTTESTTAPTTTEETTTQRTQPTTTTPPTETVPNTVTTPTQTQPPVTTTGGSGGVGPGGL
jgi:methylaspartate ammonia-lyase